MVGGVVVGWAQNWMDNKLVPIQGAGVDGATEQCEEQWMASGIWFILSQANGHMGIAC